MGCNTWCSSQEGYEGNQVNVCEALRAGTHMLRGRQCKDIWGEHHVKSGVMLHKPRRILLGQPEARRARKDPSPVGFRGSLTLLKPWFLTFSLWNHERVDFYCSESPCLWHFVAAALGANTPCDLLLANNIQRKVVWERCFPLIQRDPKEIMIYLIMTLFFFLHVMVGTAAAILWTRETRLILSALE